MSDINKPLTITIKKLLNGEDEYKIPLYQRNYDWGEREILQLLDDIADYAAERGQNPNYYIGTLVVYNRDDYYEILDGQQRMTTLSILLCAVKNSELLNPNNEYDWFKGVNLSYIHRDEADETLTKLYRDEDVNDVPIQSMVKAYHLIQNSLNQKCSERNITVSKFMKYLLQKVKILRVSVPKDTNLNHYFEIMNSRGEQLEKQEIVKANLMNELPVRYHEVFHAIWEACSNMNSYVIMNLNSELSKFLFKEDMTIKEDDFVDLLNDFIHRHDNDATNGNSDNEKDSKAISICDLIKQANENIHYPKPSNTDWQKSERFNSIINFPNFLLHVLRIVYHNWISKDNQTFTNVEESIITLDDKNLVEIFTNVLVSVNDKRGFVFAFLNGLLRLRYLFDKYVIKRENTADTNDRTSWSLKTLNKDRNYYLTFGEKNMQDEEDTKPGSLIKMLEAMFHVSAPTQSYKYWLLAVLYYVSENDPRQNPYDFAKYLFNLSQAYMLDQYICEDTNKVDFFDIIFSNHAKAKNDSATIQWEKLNEGTLVPHFVFNYYDFIQWDKDKKKYHEFNFTYRSSVEHFYPQHPVDNNPQIENVDKFGNLCLISSSINSKFSNNMPKAKLDNFAKGDYGRYSIKLQELFERAKENIVWDENLIDSITEENVRTIKESFSPEFHI